MVRKFSAGWNLPGCLPEMEPVLFDDEQDAKDFIAAEIESVEEARAQEQNAPADPYVYWIEPVDLTDEEWKDYEASLV